MNLSTSTPLGSTDKLLQRMLKDGYIVRIKDSSSGEESIEYMVGPRAKVESGDEGVKGLVRGVFGKVDAEAEELEKRLERSLAVDGAKERRVRDRDGADRGGEKGAGGRSRRREREEEEDEEELEVGADDDVDDRRDSSD